MACVPTDTESSSLRRSHFLLRVEAAVAVEVAKGMATAVVAAAEVAVAVTRRPRPPPPPPENHAPVARNDAIRVDAAGLSSIAVLSNDVDSDGDKLTVSITEAAPIGIATANTDGTVTLASLPGDFKGYTRFKYRVTDAGGLTSDATAAIFVGVEPFRIVFAGDPASNGSNELYFTDSVTAPVQITSATDGAMRLTGFVSSTEGSTVAYRRANTATPATGRSVVRANRHSQTGCTNYFPGGATLVQDADGKNQFAVSNNGQWIAAIARDGHECRRGIRGECVEPVDRHQGEHSRRGARVAAAFLQRLAESLSAGVPSLVG